MSSIMQMVWEDLAIAHPESFDYFSELGLGTPRSDQSVAQWLALRSDEELEDRAITRDEIAEGFAKFVERPASSACAETPLSALRIEGGIAKDGTPEAIELTVQPGEVVCIVGPTGSGKSRLLCDIECLAQGDTPTRRTVLIDGHSPSEAERFLASDKLVAQLSQSMQYVLELSVADFLAVHAQSRRLPADEHLVSSIIAKANELCGEPFDGKSSICLLSGGQSRALMIADVALLSRSPIVLVDELENAGVDSRKALDLLIQKGKIAFIATHDPALMLLGSRRIVMSEGAMQQVIERSEHEANQLATLETLSRKMEHLRNELRLGRRIETSLEEYFLPQREVGSHGR